jgi:hypothetical protein
MRPLYKRSVLAGPDTAREQSGPSNSTGLSVTPVVEAEKCFRSNEHRQYRQVSKDAGSYRKWCLYADVEPTRGHLALY